MSPTVNAILGVAFVGVAAAATVLMLWLRGRPSRPPAVAESEPAKASPPASGTEPGPASPRIADRKPIRVKLEKGKHHWCACGESKNQPFCDGSHRGTPFKPVAFTVEKERTAALCMCKYTQKPPFCDGSHARLETGADEAPTTPVRAKDNTPPTARNTPEEPTVELIHSLAKDGLEQTGRHGELGAMGVPRKFLPSWDDLQILTAQLANRPLADDAAVAADLVIGPKAEKPLELEIPLLVSDMSFGALSEEAKTALARGADLAGTAICSGEGGMLPAEQQANSRYMYELGTAKFGYSEEILPQIQAFHFKAGQAAKTGTGGHLPGNKVRGKIAQVRQLPEGQSAVSPPRFPDLVTPDDFRAFADRVREITGGIPIGMKMSAQHIEQDIDFALEASVDYIILDGRGGGTGAAPLIFRDNISVPTIPALTRARRHLDQLGRRDVTLIITGGLRTPADFIKALCLGADGVAIANAAIQAIGCIAARICDTNNCPSGVATQDEQLRARIDVDRSTAQLARFLSSSVELMKVMARACGHSRFSDFNQRDVTAWRRNTAQLAGVAYAGPPSS